MSDSFWFSLFSSAPSIIAAIASALALRYTYVIRRNMKALEEQTNHKMDMLLEAKDALRTESNAAQFQKGLKAGAEAPVIDTKEKESG